MIYKNFQDIKLSALGMGCMRFPLCKDGSKKIDKDATHEMIDYAIRHYELYA